MLQSRVPPIQDMKNGFYVETRYSQDGRSTEGFWVNYDPKDPLAPFLFRRLLEASVEVLNYQHYDSKGERTIWVRDRSKLLI